jgi:hypothetical protein
MLVTKYLGPTNTKGARIKVSTVSGWIYKKYFMIPWDYDLSERENHDNACKIALRRLIPKRIEELGKIGQGRYMARVCIGNGYAYGWYDATDGILDILDDDIS